MTSPAQPAPHPVEGLARVVIATVTAVVEAVVGRRVLGVARTAAGPFVGVAGWATSGVPQRLVPPRRPRGEDRRPVRRQALPAGVESVADRVLARVDVDRLLRMVGAR